ncbi:hypothetical protein [Mesorhizobium sp. NZP2077]|uniref:hypothetical protein n=1 Tax=Mesorhizobium sp. NZP2077 TaxID=2483404 RepID=UPI0015540A42|nr:hypothetical protein [Mesorhizobium sp. NZP2077]QKC80811.1 hypothetical protein EB232_03275 [Mesorhizobium sp. NZP2077]QKD14209.1 hypothetical protein HGP13_03250 [Mesorhizobium sp. NZP2077]
MVEDKFKCRVCGLSQFPDLPWGEDGQDPAYFICACCGVEAGYEDDGLQNCLSIRQHWVEIRRCGWFAPKERPVDWDMAAQIRGIPLAYKGADDERLIQTYLDTGEPLPKGLAALSAVEKPSR